MKIRDYLRSFDYLLALSVVGLCVFGIVMIYYATNTGVITKFASLHKSQIVFVSSGFVLMLVFACVDYHFIMRFYWAVYGFCLLLLVVVLVVGSIGADASSSDPARWIMIPIPGTRGLSLQPSEFAKIFMVLFLAGMIGVRKDNFNHILILGLIFLCILLPVFLIYRQPSLSACLVVAFVSLTVLVVGGLYFRTMLIGALLVVPAGIAAWFDLQREKPLFIMKILEATKILESYQWTRINTLLNPVEGTDQYLQVQQSLRAIGTGGMYGKGLGNNSYVINSHNDFIFSIIAEQFGFVGCAVLLGVLALVIVKCILVAMRADDLQGRLIAAGVAGMLLFETFVNVGVVTALLPNTGMPLPFLSYGGSTIWVHMIAIGLVLNVSFPRPKSMFEEKEDDRKVIGRTINTRTGM